MLTDFFYGVLVVIGDSLYCPFMVVRKEMRE